jgi:hypothetical protein
MSVVKEVVGLEQLVLLVQLVHLDLEVVQLELAV